MKTKLTKVSEIYEYLMSVYKVTKTIGIVGYKLLKPSTSVSGVGLNHKSLLKFKYLIEERAGDNARSSKYLWSRDTPDYSMAFNYYNEVRNQTTNYNDLKTIINNPAEYTIAEFNFALIIVNKQENILDNSQQLNQAGTQLHQHLMSEIENDSSQQLIQTFNDVKNIVGDNKDVINELIRYFKAILDDVQSNTNVVTGAYNELSGIKNSISKTIAINKTNQDNLFVLIPSLHLLLKNLLNLQELSVHNCSKFNGTGLENLNNLHKLKVWNCSKFNGASNTIEELRKNGCEVDIF